MKKLLETLKRGWTWFVKLANKKDFTHAFPLLIFASVALCGHSLLMVFITMVWIAVIAVEGHES